MKAPTETPSQVEIVTRIFDVKAGTYAAGYLGESSTAHSFGIRRQRVYELIDHCQGGRLLDVGCGPGVTVSDLVGRFEFYGVDIAPAMIDECRTTFGNLPSTHFSVGTIEHLDFPDAFFDVILSMGVVEYIDDDAAGVKEMVRVLKPGGTVVVTLPNRVSPYRFWQRTVYRGIRTAFRALAGRRSGQSEMFHREYYERQYVDLLASHGLDVTDVVYYNFNVLLFPLDRWFPRAAVRLSRTLERFGRGPWRWLGTGLIVSARKR